MAHGRRGTYEKSFDMKHASACAAIRPRPLAGG